MSNTSFQWSQKQCFYKINVLPSSINRNDYNILAYNSYNNVLCGKGEYLVNEGSFFIGVQLKDFITDITEDYVVAPLAGELFLYDKGYEGYPQAERIPKFILQHKNTRQQITLLGAVPPAGESDLIEISLMFKTKYNDVLLNDLDAPKILVKNENPIELLDSTLVKQFKGDKTLSKYEKKINDEKLKKSVK